MGVRGGPALGEREGAASTGVLASGCTLKRHLSGHHITHATLIKAAGEGPSRKDPPQPRPVGNQRLQGTSCTIQAWDSPYLRVSFPNLLEGRAVTVPLYPSVASRTGQELQEHLQSKKESVFSILTHQMGRLPPSLCIVWSHLYKSFGSFNKSLLGTYYVLGTVHSKMKSHTPVCPQGAPLI